MTPFRLKWFGKVLLAAGSLIGIGASMAAASSVNQNGLPPRTLMTWVTIGVGLLACGAAILTWLPREARPDGTVRPPSRVGWTAWIMTGLVLIGLVARMYHLGRESLWRDELSTAYRMNAPTLAEALTRNYAGDAWISFHIPLYFYRQIVGESEWALRLPSTLAGVLLVPVMFCLGARLFGRREGLIAAGLVTLLGTSIRYSQEARTYSLYLFLAALTSYFWIRLLEALNGDKRVGRLVFLGYAISSILTIHAHYFGLVLVVLQGAATVLLILIRRRWRIDILFLYTAGALTVIPWLPLLVENLEKTTFWPERPTYFVLDLFRFVQFTFGSLSAVAAVLFMLMGLIFSLGAYRPEEKNKPLPFPAFFTLAWLIVPFSILYWRSLEEVSQVSVLVTRYMMSILPPVVLLLARAITRLPVRPAAHAALAALLAAGMFAEFVVGAQYYTAYQKPRFDPAVRYVVEHTVEPDCTFIWGSHYAIVPEMTYYFRKYGSTLGVDFKGGNAGHIEQARPLLDERNPAYIWFIAQDISYEGSLVDFLKSRYQLVDEQYFDNPDLEIDFVGVRVFLFENSAAIQSADCGG